MLADEEHWLYAALTGVQRVLLTAGVHHPSEFCRMEPGGRGVMIKLFGQAEAAYVAWIKLPRRRSSITEGKVLVEASLGDLWDKLEGEVVGSGYFYNGIVWAMSAKVRPHTKKPPSYQLGAFVRHSCSNQPVAFKAQLDLVGARDQETKQRKFDAFLCQDAITWGYADV